MLSRSTKTYLFLLFTLSLVGNGLFAQKRMASFGKASSINVTPFKTPSPVVAKLPFDVFGYRTAFIENGGQYGEVFQEAPNLGKIIYGYEGAGMPVLFTKKGFIVLQRKVNALSEEEMEEMEREGKLDGLDEEGERHIDNHIKLEWIGANDSVNVIEEQAGSNYFTYGLSPHKSRGFKRLVFRELYKGIDLIYSFREGQFGFEFSFLVKPGADPSAIRMKFSGDVKDIQLEKRGNLLVRSDIEQMSITAPVAFSLQVEGSGKRSKIKSGITINGREATFNFPKGYDKNKALLIDPFVSPTTNLIGANAGMAKDIDFDYQGNIYVTGGGSVGGAGAHHLAKYDQAGVLQWTFNGVLVTPSWNFGGNYGGWVVDKSNGSVYLGPGGTTVRVIRLNTAGVYDNFMTVPSTQNPISENWKIIWNCDGGSPKIMLAGGGTPAQNFNIGVISPPSTDISTVNLTGVAIGHQDIADMIIDPKTNQLYILIAQGAGYLGGAPATEDNRMYKHNPPYGTTTIAWTRLTGFTTMTERGNRPYLGGSLNDNSINGLALNSNYFFFYDGLNLMAMNKATGATVGSPLLLNSQTLLMQGGIIADECDNVYIGSTAGLIKVFRFNGTSFDDAAVPDISITGPSIGSVYDLAYDNAKNLLYASGNGFVASVDLTPFCAIPIYSVNVALNCPTGTATASISPALPSGSTISYVLFNGATQIASNGTGVFTGLTTGINYTVKALIDQACGGTQAVKDFTFSGCCDQNVYTVSVATNCNTNTLTAQASLTPSLAVGSTVVFTLFNGATQIATNTTGDFAGLAVGTNYTVNATITHTCGVINASSNFNMNGCCDQNTYTSTVTTNCTDLSATVTLSPALSSTSSATYTLFQGSTQIATNATGQFSGLTVNTPYTITTTITHLCGTKQTTSTFNMNACCDVNTYSVGITKQCATMTATAQVIPALATGSTVSYTLFNGATPVATNGTGIFPSLTPTGNYSVTATVTHLCGIITATKPFTMESCCDTTSYNMILVRDCILRTAGVTLTPILLSGSAVTYTLWNGNTLVSTNSTGQFTGLDTSLNYTIKIEVVHPCGTYTASQNFDLKGCPIPGLFVPTAFTPNGDGKNDVLKVLTRYLKSFKHFTIYNRWGEQVFTTSDPAKGWDGRINGVKQGTAVYVWVVEAIDIYGTQFKLSGTSTLIR